MTALSAYERYAFDVNGYLIRRAVLSADEVRALRDQIDAMDLPPPGASIASQRFVGYLGRHQAFRDLLDHPAVFEVLRELCGPQLRLDHTYGIVMAPQTAGLSLHSNGAPIEPVHLYSVKAGRISCGLVAVQWALSDAEAGDGGFCCIPGSHKADFVVPDGVGTDDPLVREVPLACGDVVIFTEALCHGTALWQRPEPRLTLLYKYSPANSAWGDEPEPDEALAALLTARQRRLLRRPFIGGRPPT